MSRGEEVVLSCPECGTEVVEGAEGCGRCGTRLEWDGADAELISSAGEDRKLYISNAERGRSSRLALNVCAALAGVQLLLVVVAVRNALNSGASGGLPAWRVIDLGTGVQEVAVMILLAQFFTAFVFLSWLHRSFSNLDALGIRPGRFTPGSAVSAFLIPLVNIHRPIKVMKELWERSSLPSGVRTTTERRTGMNEIRMWWGTYLASHVLALSSVSSLFIADFRHQLLATGGADCAVHCLTISSALMLVKIIGEVDYREEASRKELLLQGRAIGAVE